MKLEVFQEIPVFDRCTKYMSERYLVSNKGNVFSKQLGKLMTKPLDKDGYNRIQLSIAPYKQKHFMIHHLVAISFINLPTKRKNEINHIDKNRGNNDANNLEWCTRKYNIKYIQRGN